VRVDGCGVAAARVAADASTLFSMQSAPCENATI
jgi:hypothetical protein